LRRARGTNGWGFAVLCIRFLSLGFLGSSACGGPGDFVCHDDGQCGVNAFCELNNHCSTFDTTCASNRRYLHAAGDDADACVAASCASNPIVALSAGASASCLLRADGGVTCWGRNDDGQLGDGTLTPRSTGVRVSGLKDVIAIAAGARHACAVRADNSVVCWGADDTGQLGDGGGDDQLTPIAVPGITSATAVVAGAGFSCALLSDRSAVCWGDDSDGEIGDGAAGPTPRAPTPVMGLDGARSLSAHWQHACAVLTDGSAVCWGSNSSGQLGDGTTTNRAQPVAVPGLQNLVAVATGLSHTCAMAAGGIHCWGDNSQGQLGSSTSGATTPVLQPTLVPIVIDPVAISSGAQHSCAVRLSGQVLCWGQNSSGQLGEGTMSSLAEPVPVTGLQGAVKVTAGATFSCAATGDGAVFCWGDDHYGQLGTGHEVVRPRPATVAISARAVAAGGAHTCAIGRDPVPGGADGFFCWGSDQAGQLGDNNDEDRSLPAPIEQRMLVPATIAAGAQDSCAIDASAVLWCWGRGGSGQLGPGHMVDTPFQIQVPLPSDATQATAVANGDAHTCVLVSPRDGLGGEIFCFGDNRYGQLGDGTLTSRATPALVSLGTSGVRAAAITAGGGHSCAIDVKGQPWCWGRGDSGQLGLGTAAVQATAAAQTTPAPVTLPGGATVRALSAGTAHTCAVDQSGGVWCWGADDRGQLGLGAAGPDVATPTAVSSLPSASASANANANASASAAATSVAAGGAHSCASLGDTSVWCWGANDSGQLGDGTTVDRPLPTKVAGAAGTVTAGALHSCAATAAGVVTCWGADTSGQLGDGVSLTISAPELARLACQ
jgi:alpha-tubulin suppressor-like RCC1 family protein